MFGWCGDNGVYDIGGAFERLRRCYEYCQVIAGILCNNVQSVALFMFSHAWTEIIAVSEGLMFGLSEGTGAEAMRVVPGEE